MKINPKKLRQLSPTQLFFIFAILLIAALYQILSPEAGPAVPSAQTNTPAGNELPIPSQTPVITRTVGRPSQTPAAVTPSAVGSKITPVTAQPASATPVIAPLKGFDYFVLALSWSPDYCASNGGDDPQQCSIGKKLGFVLHGLWPQYNQGYPSNCTTQKMSQTVKNQFAGLYPNDALFDHEWEKHGTCTGLAPAAYLDLSRKIKNSVVIPTAFQAPETAFRTTVSQMVKEFTQVNPTFNTGAFEVNCSGSGRYLKELYVCFSLSGNSTACGSELHKDAIKTCQAADFIVRNTR